MDMEGVAIAGAGR